MSQELCHVVEVMFVTLALCEYLQEVLVRSSIVQRTTWLGHLCFTFKLVYNINTSPLVRSNCLSKGNTLFLLKYFGVLTNCVQSFVYGYGRVFIFFFLFSAAPVPQLAEYCSAAAAG